MSAMLSAAPLDRDDEDDIEPADLDEPLPEPAPLEGDDAPLGGEITLPFQAFQDDHDGDPFDDSAAGDAIDFEVKIPDDESDILHDAEIAPLEIAPLTDPDDGPLDPADDREADPEDDPELVPIDGLSMEDEGDGPIEDHQLPDMPDEPRDEEDDEDDEDLEKRDDHDGRRQERGNPRELGLEIVPLGELVPLGEPLGTDDIDEDERGEPARPGGPGDVDESELDDDDEETNGDDPESGPVHH